MRPVGKVVGFPPRRKVGKAGRQIRRSALEDAGALKRGGKTTSQAQESADEKGLVDMLTGAAMLVRGSPWCLWTRE